MKIIFYRMKFPHSVIGSHLIFNGFPIFSFNGNVTIGDDCVFNSTIRSNLVGIQKPCTMVVEPQAKLSIGSNTGFSGVSIYCMNEITIGNYCNFGGNVCVWDTDFHPLDYMSRRKHTVQEIKTSPIFIGNDVFIGANTLILKGVNIGDKSVIGAGSVVVKSIPANQIWGGNPAKFLRNLNG